MINARMMYLRPGNLLKEFIIERSNQVVMSTGRVANDYSGDGTKTLKGCLAEASDEERTNHSQKDHIVTHTIVQAGRPRAKRTDKLVLGERTFYVVDVNDAASLGVSTVYYAEERRDLSNRNDEYNKWESAFPGNQGGKRTAECRAART